MGKRVKFSIVMSYHNRRQLLLHTLYTIGYSSKVSELEVIIADDASDEVERIDDLPEYFPFPIKIIRVEPEEKWYVNPCVPFNMAIREAKGSIIVIQNPEVMYTCDVLEMIEKRITDSNYIVCGVYAINKKITDEINEYDFTTPEILKKVTERLTPFVQRDAFNANFTGWYNHSMFRPAKFHFLAAITKFNMDRLRGFDERYALGVDRDDAEFIYRVENNGLKVEFLDDAVAVHQHHEKTAYQREDVKELQKVNRDLYENCTMRETRWAPFGVRDIKVSVIIPFYNRVDWAIESVNSVLNQTHQNFEIVLIDDGSTEDISKIKKLTQDARIKLYHLENAGAGIARNLGIQKATGDYIAFLDSDDLFIPHKIERQLMFMVLEDYDVSHTSYTIFGNLPTKMNSGSKDVTFPSIMHTCESALPTVMVKRSFLIDNKIQFPDMRTSQDICMMIRMAQRAPIKGLNLPLTKVRRHESFTSGDQSRILIGLSNILNFAAKDPICRMEYKAILELVGKIKLEIEIAHDLVDVNKLFAPPSEVQPAPQQKPVNTVPIDQYTALQKKIETIEFEKTALENKILQVTFNMNNEINKLAEEKSRLQKALEEVKNPMQPRTVMYPQPTINAAPEHVNPKHPSLRFKRKPI